MRSARRHVLLLALATFLCPGATLAVQAGGGQAAFEALQQGRLAEAEALCLSALGSQPSDVRLKHLLGIIRVSMVQRLDAEGRPWAEREPIVASALETLLEAERLAGGAPLPRLHDAVGYLLLARGELEQAVDRFSRALETQPANAVMLRMRGQAQLDLGRDVLARADLERAVDLSPGDFVARYRLAEALFRLAGAELARDTLSEYLDVVGGNAPAQLRSQALYEIHRYAVLVNDYEGARRALVQALSLEPQALLARSALAGVAYRLGDTAGARAEAERVLADPSVTPDLQTDCRQLLGVMALHDGDAAAARDHFDAVLRIQPTHAAALRSQAQTLRRLGDRAAAAALTERFGAVAEYETQLRLLDKRLLVVPADAPARVSRLELLLRLGRAADAREELERVRRLDPGTPSLPELRRRLAELEPPATP